MRRLKTVRRPPIYPNEPSHLPCSNPSVPTLPLSSRRPSVSFGGFGIKPVIEFLLISCVKFIKDFYRRELGSTNKYSFCI